MSVNGPQQEPSEWTCQEPTPVVRWRSLWERVGAEAGCWKKGAERATSTRCPKPRRSAGLNAQGESPTRARLRYSPVARQHGKEGSNGQKRRETGRVRSRHGGVSGWLERMCWGSGFAERVDRHRRSSMIERGLTKWSSAASVASPLQRRVRLLHRYETLRPFRDAVRDEEQFVNPSRLYGVADGTREPPFACGCFEGDRQTCGVSRR